MRDKSINNKKVMLNLVKLGFLLIGFMGLLIIFSSSVYAEGCCFNPSMGTCSQNTLQESCEGGGFSSNPTCSGSTDCATGCCIRGGSGKMTTKRECELLSEANGLQLDWSQGTSEAECALVAQSQEYGACLSGDYAPFKCRYKTYNECGTGNFRTGVSCTQPDLKTNCNVTTNTICWPENNGSVYSKDSCGNPDKKVAECSITKGTICKQVTVNNAQCKKVDCEINLKVFGGGTEKVTKKNGESWCSLDGESEGIKWETGLNAFFKTGVKPGVGSRFFRQYCLNGEVFIEPCADLKGEYCSEESGSAKCVQNDWEECIEANDYETGEEIEANCPNPKCIMAYGDPYCGGFAAGTKIDDANTVAATVINAFNSGNTEGFDVSAFIENGNTIKQNLYFCYMEDGKIVNLDPATGGNNLIEKQVPNIKEMPFDERGQYGVDYHKELYDRRDDNGGGLASCIPLLAPGISIQKNLGSSDDSGYCGALGNFEQKVVFESIGSFGSGKKVAGLIGGLMLGENPGASNLGWAGLFDLNVAHWTHRIKGLDGNSAREYEIYPSSYDTGVQGPAAGAGADNKWVWDDPERVFCWTNNLLEGGVRGCNKIVNFEDSGSLELDKKITDWLDMKCNDWTGACGRKTNWVNVGGSGKSKIDEITCNMDDESNSYLKKYTCDIKYSCGSWQPPKTGNCELCGKDGLECSEYRCKALGKNCELKNPDGADRAYCVPTTDKSDPIITSKTYPKNPVLPWTPVNITVTTNEDAHCKFNMGGSATTYETMKYDFTTGYGKTHFVILNLPGKIPDDQIKAKSYSLINGDGDYNMFIRCEDLAGNSPDKTELVTFNIMKTPDYVPAVITNFTPSSGSRIEFGKTEKDIKFQINKPAECNWDLSDKNYSSMENNFSCDTAISDSKSVNGYFCRGTITNVTTNLTGETKIFIRCKDYPELEGKEDALYKRNENTKGTPYLLRASTELKIKEISPSGLKKVTGENLSFELKAMTLDGAFSGQAVCKWALSTKSFEDANSLHQFSTTGASNHRQQITAPELGENFFRVICKDSAGNIVEQNTTFNLEIDVMTPLISRIFAQTNLLKIKTEEDSTCYYSFDKSTRCNFDIKNSSLMSGVEKEHTAEWKDDKTYFVKCKDFFGNEDSTCGKIIRTY